MIVTTTVGTGAGVGVGFSGVGVGIGLETVGVGVGLGNVGVGADGVFVGLAIVVLALDGVFVALTVLLSPPQAANTIKSTAIKRPYQAMRLGKYVIFTIESTSSVLDYGKDEGNFLEDSSII